METSSSFPPKHLDRKVGPAVFYNSVHEQHKAKPKRAREILVAATIVAATKDAGDF